MSHIPGIAYWLQVADHKLVGLDDILEKSLEAHTEALAGKTFCVRCNRAGQHDFQSIDVERFVGGGLNQQTEARGVSLKNPEITVRIDIKNNRYFRGEGLGGYPLGSQDPVLSLISGGFGSSVSSFLTTQREQGQDFDGDCVRIAYRSSREHCPGKGYSLSLLRYKHQF